MLLIDGNVIDAVISDEYAAESEVTRNPMTRGADTTSNVHNMPRVYTVEGAVSDSPLSDVAGARVIESTARSLIGLEDTIPSDSAIAMLERIRDAKQPVVVTTPRKTFPSMLLERFSVPRDRDTGKALKFTAVFVEAIFVENARTIVRTATRSSARKKNLGSKGALKYPSKHPAVIERDGKKFTLDNRTNQWVDENGKVVDDSDVWPAGTNPVVATKQGAYKRADGTWYNADGTPLTEVNTAPFYSSDGRQLNPNYVESDDSDLWPTWTVPPESAHNFEQSRGGAEFPTDSPLPRSWWE